MKLIKTVLLSTLIMSSSSLFAADHKVAIQGMAFSPANISVQVGDTVTFTNQDSAPHSGTATNKSFDTGVLNKGESGTIKVSKAGNFDYFCVVHPSMKGKVSAK